MIHTVTRNGEWLRLRPWRRHSTVLMVAGLVYLGIGIAYITLPLTDSRQSTFELPLYIADWVGAGIDLWGAAFVVIGLLVVLSARWPPASETWGYTALTLWSTLWACFYIGGIPLGAPSGNVTAWLVWLLIAFLWWAISGLLNPNEITAQIDDELDAVLGDTP